mgnify:CR=1 FL=1
MCNTRCSVLRQRNELLVVAGDGAETPGVPIVLGLLDAINDLPGALIHLRNALAPGGLVMAHFIGGQSLPALRALAEIADQQKRWAKALSLYTRLVEIVPATDEEGLAIRLRKATLAVTQANTDLGDKVAARAAADAAQVPTLPATGELPRDLEACKPLVANRAAAWLASAVPPTSSPAWLNSMSAMATNSVPENRACASS